MKFIASFALALLLFSTAARAQILTQVMQQQPSGGGFAVAHDADSSAVACGNAATCTVTFTVGAGAHNAIWLHAACDTGFSGCSLSSVVDTTNSATLTCVTANDGSPDFVKLFGCYTFDVPTGSNSFLITLSAAPGTASFGASATSYTSSGAITWDVSPTTFTALGTATSISESITTLTANAWVVDAVSLRDSNATAATAASPQVARSDAQINSTLVGASSDHGPIATPGLVSDGWSYSASTDWYCFIIGALKAH